MEIRDAHPADCPTLTELSVRSKAHWGYDAAFIDACSDELTITPSRIARETIRVVEREGTIVGFWSLEPHGFVADLMGLFVEPEAIGSGIGRILWGDLLETARRGGIVSIRIESDPHAESWYRSRGAVRIGEAPSGSIPGRMLPLLELVVGREQ